MSLIVHKPIDVYAEKPFATLEYMIAVMEAVLAGGVRQHMYIGKSGPDDPIRWQTTPFLSGWDWSHYIFRISPDSRPKKIVPMERDDYPAFFWVRVKSRPDLHCLCIGIDMGLICFAQNLPGIGYYTTLNVLAAIDVTLPRPCEYSTDRKTWHPCTKEVAG